ncbi:MAG: hypothetical protein AAFR87_26930 [Bacteroidota bacterium]
MKDLIEKYWQGETTLEEEKILREWLKTAPQSPENQRLASLVNWYEAEADIRIPNKIDPPKQISSGGKRINLMRWVIGIAAAIVLLLATVSLAIQLNEEDNRKSMAYVDTYDTPEEAYAATQEALLLISTKMNSTKKHKKKLRKIHILSDLVESYTKK